MNTKSIEMADPFSYTSAAEVEGGAIVGRTLIELAQQRDDIVLIAPGGDLDFTASNRPALERALDGTPFSLADLQGEKTDALVSTLLAYGLISRV